MAGPRTGEGATAVIPFGFGPPRPAALARAVVDAARHGFSDILLLAPSDVKNAAEHAVTAAGVLPHGAQAQLLLSEAPTAGRALADIQPQLTHGALLVDPCRIVDANWLDLHAAGGESGSVLAVTATNGTVEPAGLADLAPDAFADVPPDADLSAVFAHLLDRPDTVRWHPPAGAARMAGPEEPARLPRPALFLDRDGTLNEDYGYVSDPARLVLLPGAARAVKRANDLGWYVFLVTNQSGVGRGYYAEDRVLACNAALHDLLRAAGAHLDDMRYAADHPDAIEPRYRIATGWRKPAPGMLSDLMAHWPVVRNKSLMVGDKDSDVQAGEAAGIRSLLFADDDLDAVLAPHLAAS